MLSILHGGEAFGHITEERQRPADRPSTGNSEPPTFSRGGFRHVDEQLEAGNGSEVDINQVDDDRTGARYQMLQVVPQEGYCIQIHVAVDPDHQGLRACARERDLPGALSMQTGRRTQISEVGIEVGL